MAWNDSLQSAPMLPQQQGQQGQQGTRFGALGGQNGQGGLGGFFNSRPAGNMMQAMGAALLSSPMEQPFQNLPQTMQMVSQQQAQRDQQAELQRQRLQEEQSLNSTTQWLQEKHPDLVPLVSAGNMELAINEAFRREQEARQGNKPEYFSMGNSIISVADGQANPIYSAPAAPAEMNARQQQIARIMDARDLDYSTAVGIVDGVLSESINPVTGERSIVDLGTGRMAPIQGPQQAPVEPLPGDQAQAEQAPLWDMADDATGLFSSAGTLSSNTFGQIPGSVGDMVTFPDQVRADREFNLLQRDLIRSLSLNPRFPVAEQQRIENILARGPHVAGGTLRSSMRALDDEMRRIEGQLIQSINDPNTPIEQRNADKQTLRAVQGTLQRLGVPQAGSGQNGGGARTTSSGVTWSAN